MLDRQIFHTRTALADGLRDLFKQLEERLSLSKPLTVYLAGGMAVHLYTAKRVTTDVDAEFSGRIIIPNDLMVEVTLEDGSPQVIYLDTNYNSTFALMHEDYQDDAIPVDLGFEHIQVRVLSPVDLAVSKIARLWRITTARIFTNWCGSASLPPMKLSNERKAHWKDISEVKLC